MSQTNLTKSPEAWVRINERRASGAQVRGARMEHRTREAIGKDVKSKRIDPKQTKRVAAPKQGEVVERGGRKVRKVVIS